MQYWKKSLKTPKQGFRVLVRTFVHKRSSNRQAIYDIRYNRTYRGKGWKKPNRKLEFFNSDFHCTIKYGCGFYTVIDLIHLISLNYYSYLTLGYPNNTYTDFITQVKIVPPVSVRLLQYFPREAICHWYLFTFSLSVERSFTYLVSSREISNPVFYRSHVWIENSKLPLWYSSTFPSV